MAKKFGGKFTDSTFNGMGHSVTWECAVGHSFKKSAQSVQNGRWCPYCNQNIGESITRVFFETTFEKEFPKVRPEWLRNTNGAKLELDGYCEELQIAFEHQGTQHHSFKGRFYKETKELNQRLVIDKLKRKICKQRGVILIEIPEIPTKLRITDLGKYVEDCLRDKGFAVKNYNFTRDIDYALAYSENSSTKIEELKKIAISKKGKLLSRQYLGSTIPLQWQCSERHIWKSPPSYIKNGNWCPVCARHHLTIDDVKLIAKKMNGTLLDSIYNGMAYKYKWQCEKGHVWKAVASSVAQGSWCPRCALDRNGEQRRTPIEKILKIVSEKGGQLVSENYGRSSDKYIWECAKKHRWVTTAEVILRGSWCSECSKTKKYTLDDMIMVAKKMKGQCISKKYSGVKSKLHWQCSEGHKWKTTPDTIINGGSWCPFCSTISGKSKSKGNLEEYKKIAESRNGKCLSNKYNNSKSKLIFECGQQHQWEALPGHIKKGSWCPVCAKTAPLTIDEMHSLAKKKQGVCLSKKYINSTTKLKWKCRLGHSWSASPAKIKLGQWCPVCRGKK
ncbi:MAG: zinc-ribbon domain-containing protein [Bacteriovoracaceae bacterium]|nr:zinc-ribbon domain-containing protein [Bacteriovoracaceae bacterium]